MFMPLASDLANGIFGAVGGELGAALLSATSDVGVVVEEPGIVE
jgi:hypothetical protein